MALKVKNDNNLKILFLDLDGVINSTRSASVMKGYPIPSHINTWNKFDKIAIKLIVKLFTRAEQQS